MMKRESADDDDSIEGCGDRYRNSYASLIAQPGESSVR